MSAHGVAGPGSALSGPATRGRTDEGVEASPDAVPEVAARPDHLRVVPRGELSPRQRRLRTRLAVIATGLFVMAVLFGLVGLHVMLAQNQFRLDRLNSLWVYTSRGTGFWGPPQRLGVPSEITRLRLVPSSQRAEALAPQGRDPAYGSVG